MEAPASARLALVAVGLVTLLGQVVLLRELLVASFGSELVALLALAGWLAGTALGAFAGGRLGAASRRQIEVAFLLFAGTLILAGALARGLRPLLGAAPGAFLPLPQQLAGLALVLLPVAALGGLLFERSAALHLRSTDAAAEALPRRSLAGAYALESAGGLAGGGLATLLAAAGAGNLAVALVAALLALGAGRWSGRGVRRPIRTLLATALALLLGLALARVAALDRALTRWTHPQLATTRDTPYGRVTVTSDAGQVVVFLNDALAWESEGVAAEEFAHVAALAVERPRRMLLLGGAVEGLLGELLAHAPRRLDAIELDAALLAEVAPRLPAPTRAALADPAVRLRFGDPRRRLAEDATDEPYDLVVVAMPEPDSGQANRFYTREFFALCAERLDAAGVLALRLHGSENLLTPALTRRAASIEGALAAVFPSVAALPGATTLLLASRTPLALDPELLAARLAERRVRARLVTAPYLRYLLTDDRRAELARALAARGVPENRDGRPICYPYTLLLWLARFVPSLAWRELPGDRASLALAAGALAVLALVAALARRRAELRRALLAAGAGGAGMVLEGALILGFQVRSGVLYQDLGLLLAAFLGGLAGGAAGARAWLGETASRRRAVGLVATLAGVCLLAALALRAGSAGALPVAFALLAAAGASTGAIFTVASLPRAGEAPGRAGSLYAADLLGGAAGALVGTLWLLPVVGLAATALGLAAFAALLLLLV